MCQGYLWLSNRTFLYGATVRILMTGSTSAVARHGSMSISCPLLNHHLILRRSKQEFQATGRTKEAPVGTLVRGGLWEVDLLLRLMSPCYWPEVREKHDCADVNHSGLLEADSILCI